MNIENNDFFQRIKGWVRENNTTIEELMVHAVNGTEDVYSGWKQNEKLPSATYVGKLAKYMGVSTDWLIYGDEASDEAFEQTGEASVNMENSASGFDEKAFLHVFKQLNERDRETVLDLVQSLSKHYNFFSTLKKA